MYKAPQLQGRKQMMELVFLHSPHRKGGRTDRSNTSLSNTCYEAFTTVRIVYMYVHTENRCDD